VSSTDRAELPLLSASDDDVVASATEALRDSGVVLIRNVLDAKSVAHYQNIVGEWHRRFLDGEIQNYSLDDETATELPDVWQSTFELPRDVQSLRKWNAVGLDGRFLDLVDGAVHYDIMLRLLGTQISLTKTQFLVVPSGCVESAYLHTDAGSMSDIFLGVGSEPIMCSVQFFLTPLASTEMGNFTCVPGSHVKRFPWPDDNAEHSQIRVGQPLGGEIPSSVRAQVIAQPGDAVFFLHSLWHGVSDNTSETDRRSIIYSYARSFVRPYDYEDVPLAVLKAGSERQRRLFGDLGGWAFRPGCNYHYSDGIRQALSGPGTSAALTPTAAGD
jgi:hypothetical protein